MKAIINRRVSTLISRIILYVLDSEKLDGSAWGMSSQTITNVGNHCIHICRHISMEV